MRANNSYLLYYVETTPGSIHDSRLKKIRYDTVGEASDAALSMKSRGQLRPIEVRDDHGELVTCERMGWVAPPLARFVAPARAPQSPARHPGPKAAGVRRTATEGEPRSLGLARAPAFAGDSNS